jgi:hypothetical protein
MSNSRLHPSRGLRHYLRKIELIRSLLDRWSHCRRRIKHGSIGASRPRKWPGLRPWFARSHPRASIMLMHPRSRRSIGIASITCIGGADARIVHDAASASHATPVEAVENNDALVPSIPIRQAAADAYTSAAAWLENSAIF